MATKKHHSPRRNADRDDIPDGLEYQRAIREDRRPYEDI